MPGRTDLTILDKDGHLMAKIDVHVVPDISELKLRLSELLPGEPIEMRTASDGIVLSGTLSGAAKISKAMEIAERYAPGKVTNLMYVGGTQQVMLQVLFAEMQRSVSKSLGFNFGLAGQGGDVSYAFLSGSGVAAAPFGLATDAFGFAGLAVTAGDVVLSLFLDNLEQKGLIRTLAEPNLVALSGDTASFLAGGEVPIPVAQDSSGTTGSSAITVEFKPFGVGLSFTPTVVDEDLINLELATEVSFIDNTIVVTNGIIDIPGFGVRRANTTVELRNGQSLAIAGLLQEDFSDNVSQFPWLADTPIVGALLRSSDFAERQTELVIIITPTLVTPVSGDRLALPFDRIRIPNENELFLLGATEGLPDGRTSTLGFDSNFGYVVE